MTDRPPPHPGGPRALVLRLRGTPRLAVAVLLLLTGAVVALTAAAPPTTAPTVVTTRAVAAGATLGAADLRVVPRPVADRPADALDGTRMVLGRRVVGAVGAGEVVTTLRLAPAGFAVGLAPGRVVTAVSVATASAGVVSPGDTVRVVAGGTAPLLDDGTPTAPDVLSDDARVLAVWADPAGADDATVVVDVAREVAPRVAVLGRGVLVGLVVKTE